MVWSQFFDACFVALAQGGWNAAHAAAETGRVPCIKLLLKASPAACAAPDAHGDTPRDVALRYGHKSVVNALDGKEEPPAVWKTIRSIGRLAAALGGHKH